jgi:Predicted nucleotide-binding protein containing TIR-like domain
MRGVQARPSVLFELGLALKACPDRTVIVEVAHMRPMGDLAGLNVLRFDGSAAGPSFDPILRLAFRNHAKL